MNDVIEDLRAPRTVEDLGIPLAMIQDFTLRRALFEGRTSTTQLAKALCLNLMVMDEVVEELRELRYLEVHGLEGRDYQLGLTEFGREAASERMRICRYAGAAPVNLQQYKDVVSRQQTSLDIYQRDMEAAFADLVVNTNLLDQLGPALIAEGAMFLYGPPGTGKTSIAERLIRIHDDHVLVPRAVEVDSQVITVFDPIVHEPIVPQPPELDPRWVLCKRPCILAGGELTRGMLDLTLEASSGVYLAPLQMQANNGIFVIDDFGRQNLTPEQLLNRWIVPLDRRVDYLSLSYGVKFQIPFDCKVVFSTNLEPSSLGDEAFFRRIQNKILVPPISDEEFDTVLTRAAKLHGVKVEPDAPAYLRFVSRSQGDGDLRPYLPVEVCKILKSVCRYHGTPLVMDRANIDLVANVYFTHAAATGAELAGRRDTEAAAAAQAAEPSPVSPPTLDLVEPMPTPAPKPPPTSAPATAAPAAGNGGSSAPAPRRLDPVALLREARDGGRTGAPERASAGSSPKVI